MCRKKIYIDSEVKCLNPGGKRPVPLKTAEAKRHGGTSKYPLFWSLIDCPPPTYLNIFDRTDISSKKKSYFIFDTPS